MYTDVLWWIGDNGDESVSVWRNRHVILPTTDDFRCRVDQDHSLNITTDLQARVTILV